MKQTIILLHGLFGGLSNWKTVTDHFQEYYNIYVPTMPLYDDHKIDELDYLVTWLENYTESLQLNNIILVGNSLGGHVAFLYTHRNLSNVKSLILTGSSGLYENNTLGSFPRRHSYSYIREHAANTFYDPAIATKELVDEVFEIVNDNRKCFKIIKTAKRAQRNQVTNLLAEINIPVLLIWGKEDRITPLHVAKDFHKMLPNSQLVEILNCGHAPMMEHPVQFNEILEDFLNKNRTL
ncbi:alpha/beta fold hydrolase [Flavobacterium aquicola]|uniref:Pimeloyl-ACP methyl ester carboxylesterase n=1 Tax=Flavobacterium aquicola TaxID=1682742 RepID=A0A3E0EN09_9FLAO|nr:alpha/beta hydrolase [Flavobacterium aquicola]REG99495.1 pimeloyl-ACP methyl ester carboxylesterase [Flavobacterium aquicola]